MREMLTRLRLRWRALWKRRQLERDLEDELAFHLAMRGEGARGAFGNVEVVKEDLRDQWTFRAIENFWRDLRYAARMLRRSPGFTVVAILSLAIGIGGNTAIFSVVDAILWKSLPVRNPEQLRVVLWTGDQPFNSHSGYGTTRSGIEVQSSFPHPTYQQFRASVPAFSELIGFAPSEVTVLAGAASHYANAELVSGNFFSGLGVTTVAGRILTPEDDGTAAAPVAVVSYRYWDRHLGQSPEIVGKAIFINGHPITVVGIAPRVFLGIQPGKLPDIFLPLKLASLLGESFYDLQNADNAWVQVIGRLKTGMSEQQAMAGLRAVMKRAAEAGRTKPYEGLNPWRPVLLDGAGGIPLLRESALPTLQILSSVVGLVLLIACANLANLLLARGVARRREIAIRLSIGAGQYRLIRQLLTESLLIAGLGAAMGLSLAVSLRKLVLNVTGGENAVIDARLDWRALLFAASAALATTLLFGVVPAVRATRVDLTPALKYGAGGAAAPIRQMYVNRLLIAGQVALSAILLAGAGLFVRTLLNVSTIDPGFQPERLLLFNVDGSRSGYTGGKLLALYERIRGRVANIPGVQSATLSRFALIAHSGSNTSAIEIPEYRARVGRAADAFFLQVGPQFFSTFGIRCLAGRGLDDRDGPTAQKVAVINETFVRKYFGGRNPIAKTFQFGDSGDSDRIEIAGVCADAKYTDLKTEVPPTIYLPYLQAEDFRGGVTFELRTALPPMAIAGAVRRAVTAIDRNVPVAEMRTQEEQIRQTLGTERMFAGVVSSFGIVAALLAAIGLYGVMAYAVTRRTNEIGIRLALGAARGDVQWMVLRESLWMVAAGLLVGIPAALALTKYVQASLYGIKPNDPLSFVAAGILMVVVAAIAAWIPARRAARVDPMRALRCE